ncbi:MAG: cytochrome c [Cytophagales bacterium]|nr:cytochrome c [Cytophagales bacterium]
MSNNIKEAMKNLNQLNLIFITLVLSSIVLSSCGNIETKAQVDMSYLNLANAEEVLDAQDKGYELLKSTCYACHNPAAGSHDEMLAPPLAGIKMRYKRGYENREEFVAAMSKHVSNPSEESALMKGPIKRFGLMPNLNLMDEDVRLIVEYIYDNDLDEPDWFADHAKKMHKN